MALSGRLATVDSLDTEIPPEAWRRAAVRATLAPSVHNTQPWRFILGTDSLEIHADFSRQLHVLDPTRRQMIISCGCALLNARVSLAADGYTATVRRCPAGRGLEVMAELAGSRGADPGLAALDPVVGLRRTNRRQFADDPVPGELVEVLVDAASQEGGQLFPITQRAHRMATAVLSRRADAIENADPGYRAELRAWVSDDPRRTDGVSAVAFPRATARSVDEVPIRDYGKGELPEDTRSTMQQCLFLLGSDSDDSVSWLHTGEALQRVWLEVTRAGYAMSLFTQVIEVPSTRELLRSALGISMQPHVLLRVGRAPATPISRRRKLVEVLRRQESEPSTGDGQRPIPSFPPSTRA